MNKTPPLISVIVPAYNVENYIEICLNSILQQKQFDSFEILCIDDCSKDRTAEIIQLMSERDERIFFIQNERNLGVSETRNRALSIAKGKYIMFVDSDDMLSSSAMVNCYYTARRYKTDLLVFQAECITKNGCFPFLPPHYQKCLSSIDKGYPEHIALVTNLWIIFYKSSFLKQQKARFSDKKIFEDWEFLWNLYAHTKKIKFIDKTFYYYRTDANEHSLTKGFRERKWNFYDLLIAYQDSVSEIKKSEFAERYEYVWLYRACEIFMHFFLNSKQSARLLKKDMSAFSLFLHGESPIMMKKIIHDLFQGTHLRIVNAVYRNTFKDRFILLCCMGSNSGEHMIQCYNGMKDVAKPIKKVIRWIKLLLSTTKQGIIAVLKILINILRKLFA